MTFSHHKEGVVMSSQITHIQSSNTLPLTYITARHLCLDFQLLRPFHSLTPPAHITASHPSPGNNPPERWRAVRKNAGQAKIASY